MSIVRLQEAEDKEEGSSKSETVSSVVEIEGEIPDTRFYKINILYTAQAIIYWHVFATLTGR